MLFKLFNLVPFAVFGWLIAVIVVLVIVLVVGVVVGVILTVYCVKKYMVKGINVCCI